MQASISQILHKIPGKRVLFRADFNVPQSYENINIPKIMDPSRVLKTLPSIKRILIQRPSKLILISHLGRPNGQFDSKYSLKTVKNLLEQELNEKIYFTNLNDFSDKNNDSRIVLLENIRFHKEEEGYSLINNQKIKATESEIQTFRDKINSLGEIFINDAFGTVHRAHSSIICSNHKIRVAGDLLNQELKYLQTLLNQNKKKTFTLVLGGSKIKDKIALIENMMDKINYLIIGGAMAFPFLVYRFNFEIGKTLFDESSMSYIPKIISKAEKSGVKLYLPLDFICANKDKTIIKTISRAEDIPTDFAAYDHGPATTEFFAKLLPYTDILLWNGPLGYYEDHRFRKGSLDFMNLVAKETKEHGITSVICGGDSGTLAEMVTSGHFSHISTGGGASLEFLEGKKLPGVDILCQSDEQF